MRNITKYYVSITLNVYVYRILQELLPPRLHSAPPGQGNGEGSGKCPARLPLDKQAKRYRYTVRKTVPTVPKEPVNHLPAPTVPGRVRSVRYGVQPILPMLNVR